MKLVADEGREEVVLDGVCTLEAPLQVGAESREGLTVVGHLMLLLFGEGTALDGLHPLASLGLGLRRRLAEM